MTAANSPHVRQILYPLSLMLLALAFFGLSAPFAFAQNIIFVDSNDAPQSGHVIIASGENWESSDSAVSTFENSGNKGFTDYVKATEYSGKSGEIKDAYTVLQYNRVTILGMGEDSNNPENIGAMAIGKAKNATVISDDLSPEFAARIAYGAMLENYSFTRYKSDAKNEEKTLHITTDNPTQAQAIFNGRWKAIAQSVNDVRDIVTEPANVIYPESFVSRFQTLFASEKNISIKVLDVPAMKALGMGALLGVGQGSSRPPRLMIVEYKGAGDNSAPVAFVGKGITFDTGGISIKPSSGMWLMKFDMAGAATVVGSVLSLARRDAKVNAIAIAALAENMPSATAQRPGDVVTTMSGKTIEIDSTDAEGRLVLSDAVWYAQEQYQPDVLIDMATLTGAVIRALGDEYAGLFTHDDQLANQLTAAGATSGENLWRLPLHEKYPDMIKSDIADIRNSGTGPGAGMGAQVIGTFIKPEQKWAHIDIAGTAWMNAGAPTYPKGASGFGVRLF